MAFHYTRKYGSEGILQRSDGLGTKGESLRRFSLHHDLSLRACLEILAFVADIISDAMKNGHFHGDIKSENINILQDGSIILNGYGRPRRQTLAPENVLSIPGDVYSIGVLMLELLSGQSDLELPLEETLHNQKVLEVFLSIDWKEWSDEPFLPNMQEYLISMLFFDPSSRPHPLDVANILSEALQATHPPSLPEFIIQNNIKIQNHKEQLAGASTLRNSMMTPVEVTADSSQGVATGFWSRDKIAKMFQTDMEDDKAIQEEWTPPPQLQSTAPPPPPKNFGMDSPPSLNQHQNRFEQPPQLNQAPDYRNQGYQNQDYRNQGIPLRREETTSEPPPHINQAPQVGYHPHQNRQNPYQQNAQPKQIQPNHFSQPEVTAPPILPDSLPSIQNMNRKESPRQQNQSIPPHSLHQSIPPHQSNLHQSVPPQQQNIRNQQPSYQSEPPKQQGFSISPGQQAGRIGAGQQNTPQIGHGAQINQGQQGFQQQTPQFSQGNQAPQFSAGKQGAPYSGSAEPMSGGSNKKLLLILGGVGFLCLLIIVGVAIAFMVMDKEEEPKRKVVEIEEPSEPDDPIEEDTEEEDTEEIKEPPPPKEVVKPKTVKPKTIKKTTKKTTKPKTTKTTKTKKAEPILANSNFQVQVKFREKNASISCGDGQQKDFSGIVTLTFKSPQSCRIDLENGARGAFVARQEGSINCKLDGSNIICR